MRLFKLTIIFSVLLFSFFVFQTQVSYGAICTLPDTGCNPPYEGFQQWAASCGDCNGGTGSCVFSTIAPDPNIPYACYDGSRVSCSCTDFAGESGSCNEQGDCIVICTENWRCGDWMPDTSASLCGAGLIQTRTCIDLNACAGQSSTRTESQSTIGTFCASGVCSGGTCVDTGRECDPVICDMADGGYCVGDNLENRNYFCPPVGNCAYSVISTTNCASSGKICSLGACVGGGGGDGGEECDPVICDMDDGGYCVGDNLENRNYFCPPVGDCTHSVISTTNCASSGKICSLGACVASGDADGDIGGTWPIFTIKNPLNFDDLTGLLNAVINFIFWIGMAIAPVMFIIAGFMYVAAAGSPQRIETAKRIMLYTAIGLAVLLFAKGLVVVLESIIGVK